LAREKNVFVNAQVLVHERFVNVKLGVSVAQQKADAGAERAGGRDRVAVR